MDHARENTRQSYDRVAREYAARIAGELEHKPFDRAILDRFAERVIGLGIVYDLGCGPGHISAYLSRHGIEVSGIDLSPEMVRQAQLLHPWIDFREGGMPLLDLPDSSAGGIVVFYSLIHVPRDHHPEAFAEMSRVLRPGGALLVAFHVGEEDRHLDEWWGEEVSIDFLFFDTPNIERVMTTAGLEIEESLERKPYPDVEVATRRAYILAGKPV